MLARVAEALLALLLLGALLVCAALGHGGATTRTGTEPSRSPGWRRWIAEHPDDADALYELGAQVPRPGPGHRRPAGAGAGAAAGAGERPRAERPG